MFDAAKKRRYSSVSRFAFLFFVFFPFISLPPKPYDRYISAKFPARRAGPGSFFYRRRYNKGRVAWAVVPSRRLTYVEKARANRRDRSRPLLIYRKGRLFYERSFAF